jgi:hypothetical protein
MFFECFLVLFDVFIKIYCYSNVLQCFLLFSSNIHYFSKKYFPKNPGFIRKHWKVAKSIQKTLKNIGKTFNFDKKFKFQCFQMFFGCFLAKSNVFIKIYCFSNVFQCFSKSSMLPSPPQPTAD